MGPAPSAVEAPPVKKHKTGACHKCSGVIKQEAKATVCPKCSCRRAASCRRGRSGKNVVLGSLATVSAKRAAVRSSYRRRRYHTFDCGQRIFLAGHDEHDATACPRVSWSPEHVLPAPLHATPLTITIFHRSATLSACAEVERCDSPWQLGRPDADPAQLSPDMSLFRFP